MCVMHSATLEEEAEWLVYDPNDFLPRYTSFDNLRDAKTYCEVTAKLLHG